MTNPDYTQFIDLSLYDKEPEDIYDAALVTLQSRIPDWQPSATNIEVMLMEALAIEVSETIFNMNRIPESMMRVLLSLYGVARDPGTPPTATVEFTMQDDDGYTVPAGTEVAVAIGNDEFVLLYTDTELVVPALYTTGTVAVTGTEFTSSANGIVSGTDVELVDSIIGVDSAQLASDITGGTDLETLEAWTARGVQRLQRLSDALVVPRHFTQAALEDANVYRANTMDNYDPGGMGGPGTDPGHVTVVVYGESGNVSAPNKTALQNALIQRANANLIIHVIDPTVTAVDVTAVVSVNTLHVEATVLTAVEDALTAYLSPLSWVWSETVRVNELISVMSQVEGVDYVSEVTLPAADITLDEGLALVEPGTLTITAV